MTRSRAPSRARSSSRTALVAEVRRVEGGAEEPLVFPGFIDLQVYDPARTSARTASPATSWPRGRVQEVDDPLCLGLHLEGPFLNPDGGRRDPGGGADARRSRRGRGVGFGARTRPPGDARARAAARAEAIERLAAAGIVAALGHTLANDLTTQAALDAGATFATHLWNATRPPSARSPGPVLTLLLDERVTLGLIPDGRHLHPLVEELTVRVAGAAAHRADERPRPAAAGAPDGSLLGGDRAGAEIVARMARFGLARDGDDGEPRARARARPGRPRPARAGLSGRPGRAGAATSRRSRTLVAGEDL